MTGSSDSTPEVAARSRVANPKDVVLRIIRSARGAFQDIFRFTPALSPTGLLASGTEGGNFVLVWAPSGPEEFSLLTGIFEEDEHLLSIC